MKKILCVLALMWPETSYSSDLQSSLLGHWSGEGTVHLKPTSKSSKTNCKATFDESGAYWLRAAVICKKGRRSDRVELRFSEPDHRGQLEMNILNSKGKPVVTFEGSVVGSEITLYHPETLSFSGESYRPVLKLDASETEMRLSQIGVPTRSSNSQYLMSDLFFRKLGQ